MHWITVRVVFLGWDGILDKSLSNARKISRKPKKPKSIVRLEFLRGSSDCIFGLFERKIKISRISRSIRIIGFKDCFLSLMFNH